MRSRIIGTHGLSEEPEQDCQCTLRTRQNPALISTMWSHQTAEVSYLERMQIVTSLQASRSQVCRPSDSVFLSGYEILGRFVGTISNTKLVIVAVAGDHLQNLHVSNGRDNRLLSNWTSMNALPPSSATHQMTNHLLNKGIGNPFEQAEVIRNSQLGSNAGGNGPVCLPQFSDGRNMNLQPDFNSSSQACDRGTMTRAVFSGFGNEPDRNTMLYDRMSVYGNLNMLYKPQVSIASLKLELPSSQSAESADSAGTQRSSIINPNPIITSNNILSESESYGSNASNFLEALMQVAFVSKWFSFRSFSPFHSIAASLAD